jgi:hypothetical protein
LLLILRRSKKPQEGWRVESLTSEWVRITYYGMVLTHCFVGTCQDIVCSISVITKCLLGPVPRCNWCSPPIDWQSKMEQDLVVYRLV